VFSWSRSIYAPRIFSTPTFLPRRVEMTAFRSFFLVALPFACGTSSDEVLLVQRLAAASSPSVATSWAGVKRNLSFIHIPRAGGTAVEDVRLRAEKLYKAPVPMWGVQDTIHQHGLSAIKNASFVDGKQIPKCFLQHHPPNLNPAAFSDSDTFCVVRDPIKRMVSQFGFLVSMFGNRHNCSAASLNNYFHKSMTAAQTNPYTNDCHLMPQVAYVQGWDSTVLPHGKADYSKPRFCKHALRFDHIEDDFNSLMETYSYPLHLDRSHVTGTSTPSACGKFTRKDFDKDVLKMADAMYKEDYKLLKDIDAEYAKKSKNI